MYFRIFVDLTRNVKYKGKQNSEKIQRAKIRLALGSYVIKLCKWDQKITYYVRLEVTSGLRFKNHVIELRQKVKLDSS